MAGADSFPSVAVNVNAVASSVLGISPRQIASRVIRDGSFASLTAGTHVLIPDFRFEKDGMKVYLVERHDAPQVSVSMVLDTGYPGDQSTIRNGLSSLTANMMDEGTTTRSALQIADEVDRRGGLGPGTSEVRKCARERLFMACDVPKEQSHMLSSITKC